MAILSKPMEKYLSKKEKRGFNKSLYNSRIRKYAIQGLKDLTLLADQLPEEQLNKIFNEKLKPNLIVISPKKYSVFEKGVLKKVEHI